MAITDQVLLVVIRLRQNPTQEVLGSLFGVSWAARPSAGDETGRDGHHTDARPMGRAVEESPGPVGRHPRSGRW